MEVEQAPCLEVTCQETIKKYLPLYGLHYHQLVSGKTSEVELKGDLGVAKFNAKTQRIVYPSTVPKDRLPVPPAVRTQKGLMLRLPSKSYGSDVRVVLVSANEPLFQPECSTTVGGDDGFTEICADDGPNESVTEFCAPVLGLNSLKTLKCMPTKPRPERRILFTSIRELGNASAHVPLLLYLSYLVTSK